MAGQEEIREWNGEEGEGKEKDCSWDLDRKDRGWDVSKKKKNPTPPGGEEEREWWKAEMKPAVSLGRLCG